MEKDELNAITGKLYSAAVTYERSIFAVIEAINELIKKSQDKSHRQENAFAR